MRVLVTGHLGYIGGILVPMLQRRGHTVVGCDTNFFSNCLYLTEEPSCENIEIDVRDLSAKELQGFEGLIHLAALSNDPLGNFDPELTYQINQQASEQLAINAQKADIRRFLFASSCSNYGASDGGLLDENAEFNPQTAYGRSKCGAETSICNLANNVFEPCSLRAGTVYGLAPRIRFDLVVNNLVAHAIANGKVLLKSDGKAWRPLVHVSDVARAYAAALEAPKNHVSGEAFNVGRTEENYQIIDIAQMVADAIPDCQIVHNKDAISDKRDYKVSCDKITKQLSGYKPQWTVATGIQELADAFSSEIVLESEFEGPRFNRLAHLRQQIDDGKLNSRLRPTKLVGNPIN